VTGQNAFMHLLLFRYPECSRPISGEITSDQHNPEPIDAISVVLQCTCNGKGRSTAAGSKRHLVETWE
jgi:hypothetical protein